MCASGSPVAQTGDIQFVGKTKYLNNARAVVVHSIDDSTKLVVNIADAMDKYDIKGTFFISTEQDPPPEERFFNQLQVWLLWPRMQKAVENGHEIGAHAVTHPCSRPQSDTTSENYKAFCTTAYTDAELKGSRDMILKRTTQPYVWSWAYPCGHCATFDFIQKRIADAGYIVARNYPGEAQGLHVRPDLQTWAANPYDAPYTQVVQKAGRPGEAPPRRPSTCRTSTRSSTRSTPKAASTISCRTRSRSTSVRTASTKSTCRTSAAGLMSGTCRWGRSTPSTRSWSARRSSR